MARKVVPLPPYMEPHAVDEHDARAIKALQTGTASEGQQKLAFAYIVNRICRTYEPSYWPDSEQATAYCEGRRSVGLRLVAILNGPVPNQGKTNG